MLIIHPPLPALPGDPLGTTGVDSSIAAYGDIGALAIRIASFAVGFVGIIAVLMVLLGGFWYLTSHGDEEQAKKGRQTILYALIGVVLITLAYVIVYTLTSAVESGFATN